jgi:predicted transcriptional regulator
MTKEEIQKKKKELTDKFNELQAQKEEMNSNLKKVVEEQLRLQGEFRLLEELEKETKK